MSTLRRVVTAFLAVSFVGFVLLVIEPRIVPTYGLTHCELIFLCIVPLAAFCMASAKGGKQHYWLYYGLACSGITFLYLHTYILFGVTGRRTWLAPDRYWMAKALLFALYSWVSPLLAVAVRFTLVRKLRLPIIGSS